MPSSVSENVLSESVNPPHAKEMQNTGAQTADFKPYTSQATMTNGSSPIPTPDENISKASCVTVNAMMQESTHLSIAYVCKCRCHPNNHSLSETVHYNTISIDIAIAVAYSLLFHCTGSMFSVHF